jgi:dynein heavy chain
MFDVVKKNFAKYPLQKHFQGNNPESLLFVHFPNGY